MAEHQSLSLIIDSISQIRGLAPLHVRQSLISCSKRQAGNLTFHLKGDCFRF